MQDVRADLLYGEWEPGLLPRQPGGPVGDGGGSRDDLRVGDEPAIAFLVGTLARDGEVRSGFTECGHQAVYVPSQRPAIRGDSGRVNKHSRRHDQSRSLPWTYRPHAR